MASPEPPSGAHVDAPILVTTASRLTKRTSGLSAWAVLEDVALDATLDTDDRPVAVTSVRRIAAHLGVSKNTVQHALTTLQAAGLLAHEPERAAGRGAITRSRYRITIDRGLGLDLGMRPTSEDATPNGTRPTAGDATHDSAPRRHRDVTGATPSSRAPNAGSDAVAPPADTRHHPTPVQLSLLGDPPLVMRRRQRRASR